VSVFTNISIVVIGPNAEEDPLLTTMMNPTQTQSSSAFALLEPLNHLQSLSQNLLLSLGSPIQSKPPPPPPISAFLQCDESLAAAIQLAQVHQIKQKKIESLKDDLLALQAKWGEICQGMEDGKRDLEVLIKEGEERITAIHDAQLGKSA
jgi:mediator of RNA polymerase II transcription subunit 4